MVDDDVGGGGVSLGVEGAGVRLPVLELPRIARVAAELDVLAHGCGVASHPHHRHVDAPGGAAIDQVRHPVPLEY
jgi:hypothetical protein